MNIHPIKALSDNYIWIMEDGAEAVVIDPGEAEGVLDFLKENELNLAAVLLTHKHDDHIGGLGGILEFHPDASVYGPEETELFADTIVGEGDNFELLGREFQVFKTAGHTEGHISFLMEDKLFSGDALFSGGCGRVFTGDYKAQYEALQKFKQLDDQVEVYAAHEYTQTNLRFAQTVKPADQAILEALKEVDRMQEQGLPTLPSTIGIEKNINVFLQAETLEDFTELRKKRDVF